MVSLSRVLIDRPQRRGGPALRRDGISFSSHPGPTAFGLAFAGTLVVALLQGPKTFYYDSGGYWTLAATFVRNGHFSLLNFENTTRGYALPLINYGLQAFAQDLRWTQSSVVKLFNVLLFTLVGCVLAPALAQRTWPTRRWGTRRRLALTSLLIIFWSGYLNFPLSDFPALAGALLALVAISHSSKPAWMLVAGIAGGLAIDFRPEYLLLAPALFLVTIWEWLQTGDKRQPARACRVLCMGLLALGFATVSLPQSLASHRHYSTWSFLPRAPLQLGTGLEGQLYETYVGPGRPPQMFYVDETGTRLLREQKNPERESLNQYVGLIVEHPVFMGSLLLRHIINGLDQRYSTPYVENLHSWSNPWRRFAGFLLVFLACVRLLWPAARRSLGGAHWPYPAALLLCCLTSLPSAIEQRYLLPADLVSFVLVLAPGWPSPVGTVDARLRRMATPAVLAVSYVAYMAVVWHVVSQTTKYLRFGLPIHHA
jgi:hypothetical protein